MEQQQGVGAVASSSIQVKGEGAWVGDQQLYSSFAVTFSYIYRPARMPPMSICIPIERIIVTVLYHVATLFTTSSCAAAPI